MRLVIKIICTIATVGLFATMLAGCKEKLKEKDDLLSVAGATRESLEISLRASSGTNVSGSSIKQMIYDIIDYNNKAQDSLFVNFKDTSYVEIIDLNSVCDQLQDETLYDAKTSIGSKGEIEGIIISEKTAVNLEEDILIIDEEFDEE